jgi:uncharacterized coiled-coil protein SlyX
MEIQRIEALEKRLHDLEQKVEHTSNENILKGINATFLQMSKDHASIAEKYKALVTPIVHSMECAKSV